MNLLTYAECNEWLTHCELTISSNRDILNLRSDKQDKAIFAQFPTQPLKLAYLADALVRWFPPNNELLLWLKNWEMAPAYEALFFEALRDAGTGRKLIDAPRHVFSIGHDQSEVAVQKVAQETAILSGYLLLIMCFDWEAYVVSSGRPDRLYISDEHIMFMSVTQPDIERGTTIFRDFGMAPKIPVHQRT